MVDDCHAASLRGHLKHWLRGDDAVSPHRSADLDRFEQKAGVDAIIAVDHSPVCQYRREMIRQHSPCDGHKVMPARRLQKGLML